MKEFNKWLVEERPTQSYRWEMVNFEWGARQGWRAALEWVLPHADSYRDIYKGVGGTDIQAVPTKVIEEELNE